ncbi:MAG: serine hydrolase domain-containing protein [Mycobacterium sp.]
MWDGCRNGKTQAPWEQDTIVNVFSTTKGVASLAVRSPRHVDSSTYDAEVADYWPEFAQGGKGAVTVRQLLSHQAGLVAIKPPLTLADIADPEQLSAKIAAQVPAWAPGTRYGYHAVTLGWYQSALIHRVDPQGRTLGRFFAEAAPVGPAVAPSTGVRRQHHRRRRTGRLARRVGGSRCAAAGQLERSEPHPCRPVGLG